MDNQHNKLIFTLDYISGCRFCNLGVEVSKRLKSVDIGSSTLPFVVEDLLAEIVEEYTFVHSEGWKYLAIENFDILFEPALGINIDAFIKRVNRGLCLIIKTDHPARDDSYFPFIGDESHRIDLNGISYTQKGFITDNR